MSTVKASWSQLPAQGQVTEVCHDLPGNRLASSSIDGDTAYVQVWERDCCTGDWDLVSQLEAPHPIAHLAWAHPESGPVLAGGTASGSVVFWEPPRPPSCSTRGDDDDVMEEMRDWRQVCEVACSKHGVVGLAFAPRQLGLTIAAACADGSVHVLEADRVLAPRAWTPQCKLLAGGDGATCAALAWRPFSPGVDPLIAVAVGTRVEVWQYLQSIMAWQRVATLPASEGDARVSSVHWAPTLGRPTELVAAARGNAVDIVSLSGDTASLDTELLTTLKHGDDVWRVEFNMFGTCLAAATVTNLVHLWKPDFVGKWLLVSVIAGSPDAAAETDDEAATG